MKKKSHIAIMKTNPFVGTLDGTYLLLQTVALELYPSPSVCFPLPPWFPSALKINVLHFQQCCQTPIQRKKLNVRFAHL